MGGVGSLAGEGEEDELEPEGEERLNGGFLSPGLSRREDMVVSSWFLVDIVHRWRYARSTVLVQDRELPASLTCGPTGQPCSQSSSFVNYKIRRSVVGPIQILRVPCWAGRLGTDRTGGCLPPVKALKYGGFHHPIPCDYYAPSG